MRTIQLIVTGDIEKLALHRSLETYFPSQRAGKDVTWLVPRKTQGATSSALRPAERVFGPMRQLALAAVVELEVGRTGTPADLIIVVDDGELGNMDDPANIVAHFRLAMLDVIDSRAPDPADNAALRRRVRERISFHLMMPMVEAHFFIGSTSLNTCGVSPTIRPRLARSDVEQFETDDPLWTPTCEANNTLRQRVTPWWRHERHPKHYLEHLLERSGRGVYLETSEVTQQALIGAEWRGHASENGCFARSLFEDLSVWFDVPNPMGAGACAAATWPSATTRASSLVLRNL